MLLVVLQLTIAWTTDHHFSVVCMLLTLFPNILPAYIQWSFSRRTKSSMVCIYREIYFKDLAHIIVRAGKFKICRVSLQAWKRICNSDVKGLCLRNPFFFKNVNFFLRPSIRWGLPIVWGSIICFTENLLFYNLIPLKQDLNWRICEVWTNIWAWRLYKLGFSRGPGLVKIYSRNI